MTSVASLWIFSLREKSGKGGKSVPEKIEGSAGAAKKGDRAVARPAS